MNLPQYYHVFNYLLIRRTCIKVKLKQIFNQHIGREMLVSAHEIITLAPPFLTCFALFFLHDDPPHCVCRREASGIKRRPTFSTSSSTSTRWEWRCHRSFCVLTDNFGDLLLLVTITNITYAEFRKRLNFSGKRVKWKLLKRAKVQFEKVGVCHHQILKPAGPLAFVCLSIYLVFLAWLSWSMHAFR